MLETSDAFAVMAVARLGYQILTDESGFSWYRKKGGICIGPFISVKVAAERATNEYHKLKQEEFLRHEMLPERDH